MPEESITGGSLLPHSPKIPLPEALVGLSLPLLWEIVTLDVSAYGNESARIFVRGGGWVMKKREQSIKNAICGKG